MNTDTETKQQEGSGKRRVILTSWAAVATALFLFTLIFGAIYVINIRPECDDTDSKVSSAGATEGKTVDLKLKNGEKEEKETIHENTAAHTDFIIKKNSDGFIELIVGVDYNRKMSCVYLAREDVCVLTVGEDLDWYEDVDKNTTIVLEEEDNEVALKMTLKNKVTDMSLLTAKMQTICSGKDVYWASSDEDTEDTDVAKREKRSCSYCSYYRYCYRCRLCRWYGCFYGYFCCYRRCYYMYC